MQVEGVVVYLQVLHSLIATDHSEQILKLLKVIEAQIKMTQIRAQFQPWQIHPLLILDPENLVRKATLAKQNSLKNRAEPQL